MGGGLGSGVAVLTEATGDYDALVEVVIQRRTEFVVKEYSASGRPYDRTSERDATCYIVSGVGVFFGNVDHDAELARRQRAAAASSSERPPRPAAPRPPPEDLACMEIRGLLDADTPLPTVLKVIEAADRFTEQTAPCLQGAGAPPEVVEAAKARGD